MWVGDQQEGDGENSEGKPGRLNGVGDGVRPRASAQKPGEKGAMHSAFDITGCGHLCWKTINIGWVYRTWGGQIIHTT